MKIKRKIWALLLSAAMIFTFLPAAAFAEAAPAEDQGGVYPVSVENFSGELHGTIGTTNIKNLYTEGYYIEVKYSDDSVKKYIYSDFSYEIAGEKYTTYGFLLEGSPKDSPDPTAIAEIYPEYIEDMEGYVEGENDVTLQCMFAVAAEDPGYDGDEYTVIPYETKVICSKDVPVQAVFVPAEGFVPTANIGYNYLTDSVFYGGGNKFVVTYHPSIGEDYPVTYFYNTYYDEEAEAGYSEGFFDTYWNKFDPSTNVDCYIKKGENQVKFYYFEDYGDEQEMAVLEFTETIIGDKYDAYEADSIYFAYTGKAISKKAFANKLVMKDSDGNVIPKSEYTYTWKSPKAIGWYFVDINFWDKTKYVDSVTVSFRIGPKTPKITKLTGKKKAVKVKWKKFTKSQLKNIDGMYIELATDKDFMENYKIVTVSKKALKKGTTKTIKKLKGKKKYYVRLSTYKKVKTSEGTDWVFSGDSKKKSAKTKK